MSRARTTSSLHRLAQVACAVAAVVFGWTAFAAVRVSATAPIGDERTAAMPTAPRAIPATLTDADLERAVAHDMFSALRTAPNRAYAPQPNAPVMSDDGDNATADVELPLSLPTVQGTAVNAAGEGFAMCATPGGPVLVVRPGDRVGEFTVLGIERTRVIFRDGAGRRYTVDAVASPSGAES